MMNLGQHFLDYLDEEYGRELVYSDEGFISFSFHGPECHLADVFIAKEYREKGLGKELFARMLARAAEEKSEYVSCIVGTAPEKERAKRATWMLRTATSWGFQVTGANNGHVILNLSLEANK